MDYERVVRYRNFTLALMIIGANLCIKCRYGFGFVKDVVHLIA